MKSGSAPSERRIVFFRHGAAEPSQPGDDDARRRLTSEGREKTALAARGLAKILQGEPKILSSPYSRAAETARLLREALGGQVSLDLVNALAPGLTVEGLLAAIRSIHSEVIIVVGHAPDLNDIMGTLIAIRGDGVDGVRKAGACAIRLRADGSATLEWFVTPQILRALGRE